MRLRVGQRRGGRWRGAGVVWWVAAAVVWPAAAQPRTGRIEPRAVPTQTRPSVTEPAPTRKPPLKRQVGFMAAAQRLGADLPAGSSVTLGLVEGGGLLHAPDPVAAGLHRVTLVHRSPLPPVAVEPADGPRSRRTVRYSDHATMTARLLTGRLGLVQQPEALHLFSVGDWLGGGMLNLGTGEGPRWQPGDPDVLSHSWIQDHTARAVPVLRRLDWLIDTHGVVVAAGVNNGAQNPVPAMLGTGHNVLAVGVSRGASSGGGTRIEGAGRSKPDIVAPTGTTSEATPVVAAAAALAMDRARTLKATDADRFASADRPEVVKAAMLASATRTPRWAAAPGRPLDDHLGAGQVEIDGLLRTIEAGRTPPGGKVRTARGFAYPQIAVGDVHRWSLEPSAALRGVAVALAWHRRIEGRTVELPRGSPLNPDASPLRVWRGDPALADLDLRLVSQDGLEVAASRSRVDNIEFLHLPRLEAGRYFIEVTRPEAVDQPEGPWTYAMAWSLAAPAPATATDAAPPE